MPSYSDEFSSPTPFSRGVVNDVDGLMTATASAASAETYQLSGGDHDFDGAEVAFAAAGRRTPARTVTITRSSSVGSYSTSPVTITGTYDGEAKSEQITPPNADGGDTLEGTQPFDDPTTVVVSFPAQNDANGSFEIGVGDVVAPPKQVFRMFRAHVDGDVVVAGQDGLQDVVPAKGGAAEPISFVRLKAATAVGVTVYS